MSNIFFENLSKRVFCQLLKTRLNNNKHELSHKALENLCYSRRNLYNTTIRCNINAAANLEANNKTHGRLQDVKNKIKTGPSLADFINDEEPSKIVENISEECIPYLHDLPPQNQKVYFEIYGCQMNVSDVEVIWSILQKSGYKRTTEVLDANIILLITCAIRDGAESKIWDRLNVLNALRVKKKILGSHLKIGLLGCMAERLKHKIVEKKKLVDVIAGPDSYRDLPRLLAVTSRETAINVVLSFDETYADIMPVRLNPDSTSAFVSIMRGCDNMCTYCIVPFTRGREKSRPITSILEEVQQLSDQGVKDVTLLGQNVNSYRDTSQSEFYMLNSQETHLAKGFKTVYKSKKGGLRFADLLDKVSLINPEMRIRFTSPHPKDFPDEVLQLINERQNICRNIHLPAQSGNSTVLERMRRGYSRESYLELVQHIRETIPNVSLSSDFIAGFCGETEEQFEDTISLIESVKYHMAYLFAYSMREKTTAHRRYNDDVDPDVKLKRCQRMIDAYKRGAKELNLQEVGKKQLVLVENVREKHPDTFRGRNDNFTNVVFPSMAIPSHKNSSDKRPVNVGDFLVVEITNAGPEKLTGIPLYHSSISEFSSELNN